MKERANPDRTKKKELITLKLIPVVVAASEVRIFALMKVKAIIPVAPTPMPGPPMPSMLKTYIRQR